MTKTLLFNKKKYKLIKVAEFMVPWWGGESGRKRSAQKQAEQLRKKGWYVRVVRRRYRPRNLPPGHGNITFELYGRRKPKRK